MNRLILTIACFIMTGFSLNCGGVPPTFYYRISHEGHESALENDSSLLPLTIGVAQCTADVLFESDKIVYQDSPYQARFYHYRRWIAPPKKMVTEKVLQQFQESGAFQRVVSWPSSYEIDYILKGHILAFEEWDESNVWYGLVSIEFQLLDAEKNEVLWKDIFSERTLAQRKEPVEVVKAISESLYKVVGDAIAAIKESLKKYKS